MPAISVNVSRCVGCQYCMLICSVHKAGSVRPSLSRIEVIRDERNGEQRIYVCQQCDDAPCVQACPTGALFQKQGEGVVALNSAQCIRCALCVAVCPHRAVRMDPDGTGILKCDLCDGQSACISSCPTAALEVLQ